MVSAWEISIVVPLMEAGLLGSAYTDSASLCLGGRKGRGVTPQASAYPPQNARMAFCSAAALQNPNAAAALLSPPYCLGSIQSQYTQKSSLINHSAVSRHDLSHL